MKYLTNKLHAGWKYIRQPQLRVRIAIQTMLAVALATSLAWMLKLSMPFWASITASILVASSVGAIIDKSLMRIVGTVCGAAYGVIIVVLLAQHTIWLVISLLLLIMICCYCSSISRYQYAFILLPVTAIMIALMAATTPGLVYSLATARTLEIVLGVGAVWLVSLLIFPTYARDKLAENLTDVLIDLKQSFIEVTEHYLAKADNASVIAKQHQEINKKLNTYKNLLVFAKKEFTGENFSSVQMLNNIRNMRLLLAQQVQFNNTQGQSPKIATQELTLMLLKQAVEMLVMMFDLVAKSTDVKEFNACRDNFHELIQQIYNLREKSREDGHIYQYDVESNTIFYAFLELLEKTQSYLNHIINGLQESFKLTTHLNNYWSHVIHHFWANLRSLPDNITEIKHALKLTLSATITMLIWIYTQSTAVVIGTVSVLAVAQLNMYNSKEKAKSRILGCFLGGLSGILLILLPLNVTLFYSLVLIAVGIFAYLSAGKGRLIDIGVQANFAMFTAVITNWGAPITVEPALGRLAGVLLGSIIAATIGYFIWPLNPIINIRKRLAFNCYDFAKWLKITTTSFATANKQADITLIRRTLIHRIANTESLFVYLNDDKGVSQYQRLIDLQYQVLFNLLSFENYKNNLATAANVLQVDIQHYLQQAINKLDEFNAILLDKPYSKSTINIHETLHAAKQQLIAIRQTTKIASYKVQQVKEFMVVMNDLIQLLTYMQRFENVVLDIDAQKTLIAI